MCDNLRSRQLNPEDDLFWKSRGYPERPYDWQQLLEDMGYYDDESDASSSESEYSEHDDAADDNSLRSRQLNPENDLFWKSRGYPERPHNWQQLLEDMGYYDDESDASSSESEYSEHDDAADNNSLRSRQLNPENDLFWKSRGYPGRPQNWQQLLEDMGYYDNDTD